MTTSKEGGLQAPTRHQIDWKSDSFYDSDDLNQELERVFDICHGCRRCVSLCNAFPTLFDLVDDSQTLEIDGVDKKDFQKVVDQCYLCDLCFLVKCPYIPPHEFNLDFPHLMLRSKIKKFADSGASIRDKLMTSTFELSKVMSIPLVDITYRKAIDSPIIRTAMENTLKISKEAVLPRYSSTLISKQYKNRVSEVEEPAQVEGARGKVAIFPTCYCDSADHASITDMVKVFEHNNIETKVMALESCCGMPKLELGDMKSVEKTKETNIEKLHDAVQMGYDLVSPIPSCVLMFKQELPLLFDDDEKVMEVSRHFFDPFQYLNLYKKAGQFNTKFKVALESVLYQVACHQRTQNIGNLTRDLLKLIPDIDLTVLERCSGQNGTYAAKQEQRKQALKIAQPIVKQIDKLQPKYVVSDCPLSSAHLKSLASVDVDNLHPISLLKIAYGLK